ncbi:14918_t:CDS:2, partial [Gigaspora rosea]
MYNTALYNTEEYLIELEELTKPIAFTKNEVNNHRPKIKKKIEVIKNGTVFMEDTNIIEATPTGDSSLKRIHDDLNE